MRAWEYEGVDIKTICEQIRLRRLRTPAAVRESSYWIAVDILGKLSKGEALSARDKSWAVNRWHALNPGMNPPKDEGR